MENSHTLSHNSFYTDLCFQSCTIIEIRGIESITQQCVGAHYTTDKHTGILLTQRKVITDLFVIEMKEIYVHVYTRLLIC